MSWIPNSVANLIADYFYGIDQQVRTDLLNDRVVGERDYLSRFITLIEYPFGIKGKGSLPFRCMFYANNFSWPNEQRFGCDTLFLFKYGATIKLLAIEGKYPKLHKRNNQWDTRNPQAKLSHFSDQITRQSILVSAGVPVLELFITSIAPISTWKNPHSLDSLGSSCVDYSIAQSHKPRFKSWKHGDAIAIVNAQYSLTRSVSIRYFINEILQCNLGQRIDTNESDRIVSIKIPTEQPLDIPLFSPYDESKKETSLREGVIDFMRNTGLRNFGIVECQPQIAEHYEKGTTELNA